MRANIDNIKSTSRELTYYLNNIKFNTSWDDDVKLSFTKFSGQCKVLAVEHSRILSNLSISIYELNAIPTSENAYDKFYKLEKIYEQHRSK